MKAVKISRLLLHPIIMFFGFFITWSELVTWSCTSSLLMYKYENSVSMTLLECTSVWMDVYKTSLWVRQCLIEKVRYSKLQKHELEKMTFVHVQPFHLKKGIVYTQLIYIYKCIFLWFVFLRITDLQYTNCRGSAMFNPVFAVKTEAPCSCVKKVGPVSDWVCVVRQVSLFSMMLQLTGFES